MTSAKRVELQAEVDGHREQVYPLVATADGLRRWLDAAELDARPGGRIRLRLRDEVAVGAVVAIDPPQHLSFSWDWESEALGVPSIVAFDLIDHGSRTHLTMRHVGFPTEAQQQLHEALWRAWFPRLVAAAAAVAREPDGRSRAAEPVLTAAPAAQPPRAWSRPGRVEFVD